MLIDRYAPGENAGYPTLCKGRFDVGDEENYYAIEEPTSLNTLELLPQLAKIGVRAIKIEGRQRSPAYVADVTRVWARGHRPLHGPAPPLRPQNPLDGPARPGGRGPAGHHRPWAPTTAPLEGGPQRSQAQGAPQVGARSNTPMKHRSPHHENHPGPPAVLLATQQRLCVLRSHGRHGRGRDLPGRNSLLAPPRAAPVRLAGLARHPQGKGKQVVMSSQVLLESGSDVAWLHKLAANGEFTVGSQTTWAPCTAWRATALCGRAAPEPLQPQSVQWMAQLGASRWVMPLEMRHQDLAVVQAARPQACRPRCSPRAVAAGVFGPLLHRAALQPAQGRLPLQLHGTPRRPAHAHAREGRLSCSTARKRSRPASTT